MTPVPPLRPDLRDAAQKVIDAVDRSHRPEAWFEAIANLKAALSAAPQETWQPIETAPKDGTWILVTSCNTSPLVLVAGYRVEANRHSYPADRWVAWGNLRVEPPTHWMPLPSAPDTKE